MDCPRCRTPLIGDEGTWRCPSGDGRFVPAEAMSDKPRAQKRLAKADQTLPTVPCPACSRAMTLTHPKGIDVDVCRCGGIWLDAGEEKLLRERSGGAGMAVVEMLAWLGAGLLGG